MKKMIEHSSNSAYSRWFLLFNNHFLFCYSRSRSSSYRTNRFRNFCLRQRRSRRRWNNNRRRRRRRRRWCWCFMMMMMFLNDYRLWLRNNLCLNNWLCSNDYCSWCWYVLLTIDDNRCRRRNANNWNNGWCC